MDNSETLKTFGKQDTGRGHKKKQKQKTKNENEKQLNWGQKRGATRKPPKTGSGIVCL
jgi:hypothetical protein